MVITVALSLTGISMVSSFLIIYKKYTSNLNENDLKEINDFILTNGITDSSMNIGIAADFIRSDIEKRLNWKSNLFLSKHTFSIAQKPSRASNGHEALTQEDRPDENFKISQLYESESEEDI